MRKHELIARVAELESRTCDGAHSEVGAVSCPVCLRNRVRKLDARVAKLETALRDVLPSLEREATHRFPTDFQSDQAGALWKRVDLLLAEGEDYRYKAPCLYPLADGRRCCECETCHEGEDR